MKRTSTTILTIAFIGLLFAITALRLSGSNNIPVWIVAERRVSENPPISYAEILDNNLEKYPQLVEAIQNANDAYRIDSESGLATLRNPSGPMIQMEHEKGIDLLLLCGINYQYNTNTYQTNIKVESIYYKLYFIISIQQPKTL